MSGEEAVPNDRLRRARSLKGWSQADLAAKVGTSFEMISRWERGITVPSPYYRERLYAALSKTPEQLGLRGEASGSNVSTSGPHILLMSSHADAGKPVVAHLKTLLHDEGITVWSSRNLGRQGQENSRANLRAAMHSTLVMLIILSPSARTSRHIREAVEMASLYQLPIYGIWIEGDRWQDYLPESSSRLAGLTDARERTAPVLVGEITTALAEAGLTPPVPSLVTADTPDASVAMVSPARVPLLQAPPQAQIWRSNLSARRTWLLLELAAVIVVALLGSASLLVHSRPGSNALIPAHEAPGSRISSRTPLPSSPPASARRTAASLIRRSIFHCSMVTPMALCIQARPRRCPLSGTAVSALTREPGPSTYGHTWSGRMGSRMMPAT